MKFLTQPYKALVNCPCNLTSSHAYCSLFLPQTPFLVSHGCHGLLDQGLSYALLSHLDYNCPIPCPPKSVTTVFIASCTWPSMVHIRDVIKVCFSVRNHIGLHSSLKSWLIVGIQIVDEWIQELSSMSNGRMMTENIKRIGRKWEGKLNMLGENKSCS